MIIVKKNGTDIKIYPVFLFVLKKTVPLQSVCSPFPRPGGGMVDALVSGTSVRDDVQVRVLSWAPIKEEGD